MADSGSGWVLFLVIYVARLKFQSLSPNRLFSPNQTGKKLAQRDAPKAIWVRRTPEGRDEGRV